VRFGDRYYCVHLPCPLSAKLGVLPCAN
jgi:hypothetical protein